MALRVTTFALTLAGVFTLFWMMWPAPVNPDYWDEPEPPAMTGVLQPDDALLAANVTIVGGRGTAEGLAIDEDGRVYFGTPVGEIGVLDPATGQTRTLARVTDSQILGLEWIAPRHLGVAAVNGLFALDLDTLEAEHLSHGVLTHDFGYVNDLAVAATGEIYFSDSSTRWGHGSNNAGYVFDLLENRPHGALYVWDPADRQSRLVLDRLYYANGVALADDGESVFVVESFRYRIMQIWVTGPYRGRVRVFAENLPGIPDGITSDGEGRLYVAMSDVRNPLLSTLHRNPALSRMLSKLPRWAMPSEGSPRAFIAVLDAESGAILDTLHDPDGRFCQLSSTAMDGRGGLWFSSTQCGYLAHLPALQTPLPGMSDTLPSQPVASDRRPPGPHRARSGEPR
jgi:sugar lactone lactonase YvrE